MAKYTVGIAGSTAHTRMCAAALLADERFEVIWILTPPPQPIGRKQVITKNPLHVWAEEHQLAVTFVERKITPQLQEQLVPQPDFLLVVDFGYLIPKWLLDWPKIAPLNVHPSLLPRWRGSSPGQFVLLHGEENSAVTIMVMGEGLDTGPVLWQGQFAVGENWTQTEYYHHSFTLAAKQLPQVMNDVATGAIQPLAQPVESPTPIAKRFQKDDGFVAWETVAEAAKFTFSDQNDTEEKITSPLLQEIRNSTQRSWSKVIADAVRGLSPWPGVWTFVPTHKGLKRMKILAADDVAGQLELRQVQLEGQQPTQWSQLKSLIK